MALMTHSNASASRARVAAYPHRVWRALHVCMTPQSFRQCALLMSEPRAAEPPCCPREAIRSRVPLTKPASPRPLRRRPLSGGGVPAQNLSIDNIIYICIQYSIKMALGSGSGQRPECGEPRYRYSCTRAPTGHARFFIIKTLYAFHRVGMRYCRSRASGRLNAVNLKREGPGSCKRRPGATPIAVLAAATRVRPPARGRRRGHRQLLRRAPGAARSLTVTSPVVPCTCASPTRGHDPISSCTMCCSQIRP